MYEEKQRKDLGKAIKKERQLQKLTQQNLAEKVSEFSSFDPISQSTIAKIESGERNPSFTQIAQIAKALNTEVQKFIDVITPPTYAQLLSRRTNIVHDIESDVIRLQASLDSLNKLATDYEGALNSSLVDKELDETRNAAVTMNVGLVELKNEFDQNLIKAKESFGMKVFPARIVNDGSA